MLIKLSFYYRACDSAQNGVHSKGVTMNLRPVKSDGSFKLWYILYKNGYFGIKKKESDEQRKSTSTNLVEIFKDYHSAWPKEP